MLCFTYLFASIYLVGISLVTASPIPSNDGNCNGLLACDKLDANNVGNNLLNGNDILSDNNDNKVLDDLIIGDDKRIDQTVTNLEQTTAGASNDYPTA
ncbi:hypothetical protein DFH28DRAFT_260897 [Melampsora americana]|nr:hypothetical protein DFH28DRAFT_260897 [Melampsora americana]